MSNKILFNCWKFVRNFYNYAHEASRRVTTFNIWNRRAQQVKVSLPFCQVNLIHPIIFFKVLLNSKGNSTYLWQKTGYVGLFLMLWMSASRFKSNDAVWVSWDLFATSQKILKSVCSSTFYETKVVQFSS